MTTRRRIARRSSRESPSALAAAAMIALLAGCSGSHTAERGDDRPRAGSGEEATRASTPPRWEVPLVEPVDQPGTEPVMRTTPDGTPMPTMVIDDWDELEGQLHAIYRATVRTRTRADGRNELCARPAAVVFGTAQGLSEVCTPMASVLGWQAPWPPLAVEGTAIVATMQRGASEAILVSVACTGACAEPPREELLQQARCGEIAAMWASLPPASVSCSTVSDCELLTSMCFAQALRRDRADDYRDVVARWGGTCGHPAAGACAPFHGTLACTGGACVARP
jgi:hypothetical protein